ncbi:hypothetical protein [Terrihabitans rhizophilus]|uniref:Uncharacterized protein n=1 Tax=Terrihabitans rhizophilus TaxID=3092662 RepID=A0ABU4RQP1_9HYPH|nr:hypothetical protein [Terrihabitans sp. PJ23]MDX6807137.1 hypothetical protein [Terrihabitans sp. PJ23]
MQRLTALIKYEGELWAVDNGDGAHKLYQTRDAALRSVLNWANSVDQDPTVIQLQIVGEDGITSRLAIEAVPGAILFDNLCPWVWSDDHA